MQIKRILSCLLCVALFTGLLSGCRIGQPGDHTPTGDGLSWEDDVIGPAGNHNQQQGQELTLTYYKDRSLNPYTCTDYTNRALFSLLYQSLFVINRDYQVEPMLCSAYSVSEDGKTYVFYLEQATFSDGSLLTAGDVEASLLAAKDNEYYAGRFTYIRNISLRDDGGIQIDVAVEMDNLPILLDIPIVKQTEVSADSPLGTGPYTLETGTNGVRLQRREKWWCKSDLWVTAPSIALLDAQSVEQVRNNFLDKTTGLNLVCTNPCSDSYRDYGGDFEQWDCENGIFLYLSCSMDSAVFSVPEVRSALTFAIDRDSLVQEFYRGFARSATLPASPQSPYYNTSLAEKYNYDGVKFAQAISDAGLRDAPIVLLVNATDSLRVRVARAVGKMLSDCGLSVKVNELRGESYTRALRYREFDLCLGSTKLSANMDLSPFFAETGALSYGGINDIPTYQVCQQALANVGNYYTLHQMIAEDGRLCPILFQSYSVYAKRGLASGMAPARDNVFYYSRGKTMDEAKIDG